VFYADDTPKTSLPVVQRAILSLQRAGVPSCSAAGVQAFAARSSLSK